MIGYLYFAFFIIALIADFLPFSPIIKTVSSLAINSVQTIKSKNINDSEKEKILLFNSFEIFKHSIKRYPFNKGWLHIILKLITILESL